MSTAPVRKRASGPSRKAITPATSTGRPGPIDTPMLRASTAHAELAARETARTAGRVLLGGPGRPEDVAGMIAFLLGPDARFLTGAVLTCDGGWTAA